MKLKFVAAAVALVATSGAFAVTSSTFGGQHDAVETASGTYFGATSFVDIFSFSLAAASNVVSSITSSNGVTFGDYALYGVGADNTAGTFDDVVKAGAWFLGAPTVASVNLTAGSYYYRVSGKVASVGTYSLGSSVTAVPEPETYAMMLAGLGALGFLARRRNNG